MSVLEASVGPSPKIADTKLYDTQPVTGPQADGPDIPADPAGR